jgi:hypothetical protein
MIKSKLKVLLIILCLFLFKSVDIIYSFKDSDKAKVEMSLTVKLSPEIQATYFTVQRVFHNKQTQTFIEIFNITK